MNSQECAITLSKKNCRPEENVIDAPWRYVDNHVEWRTVAKVVHWKKKGFHMPPIMISLYRPVGCCHACTGLAEPEYCKKTLTIGRNPAIMRNATWAGEGKTMIRLMIAIVPDLPERASGTVEERSPLSN